MSMYILCMQLLVSAQRWNFVLMDIYIHVNLYRLRLTNGMYFIPIIIIACWSFMLS